MEWSWLCNYLSLNLRRLPERGRDSEVCVTRAREDEFVSDLTERGRRVHSATTQTLEVLFFAAPSRRDWCLPPCPLSHLSTLMHIAVYYPRSTNAADGSCLKLFTHSLRKSAVSPPILIQLVSDLTCWYRAIYLHRSATDRLMILTWEAPAKRYCFSSPLELSALDVKYAVEHGPCAVCSSAKSTYQTWTSKLDSWMRFFNTAGTKIV